MRAENIERQPISNVKKPKITYYKTGTKKKQQTNLKKKAMVQQQRFMDN